MSWLPDLGDRDISIAVTRTESNGERDDRWSAMMKAAQDGDAVAYAGLLQECVDTIRSAARFRGVPADLIDDVVQETLITIHRVRQTYDPARPFAAWLRAIADRRAIDALRRYHRHGARELHVPFAYEAFPDPETGPALRLEQSDRAAELRRAMDTLSEAQREAVQLLSIEEKSLKEAEQVTGRSKAALKVNLHRALKTLRRRLGDGLG